MHLLPGNLRAEQVTAALNGLSAQLNLTQCSTLSVALTVVITYILWQLGFFFFFVNKPLYPSLSLLKTTKDESKKPSVSRKMRALIYYASKIQLCWKKHTEPATLMDTSSLGGAFYRHVSFDPIRTISGYKPPSPLTALLTSAGLQGPCIQGTRSLFPDDVIASGAKSLFGGVFFDFLLFPSWTQEAAQARLASPAR